MPPRICRLPECGKEFMTNQKTKNTFCCYEHRKAWQQLEVKPPRIEHYVLGTIQCAVCHSDVEITTRQQHRKTCYEGDCTKVYAYKQHQAMLERKRIQNEVS